MQPPRLSLGLVLIPSLAFLFAWQADSAKAGQGSTDSTSAKKKSTGSKTKSTAGSPPQSSAEASKQSATKQGASAGTAKNSTARKSTAARRRSKAGSKAAARRAPRQQQPEPDRIRAIQQALKDRGYAVEATGAWDGATVEALKKFQADQNIDNLSGRGKLDSLTLIALGLGPQREPPPAPNEAPQRSPEGHFP